MPAELNPVYNAPQRDDRPFKDTSVTARKMGRPLGAKSRPRKIILAEKALGELRQKVGPYLPADDMDYLERILSGGETPELKRDLDIFLALQLKALLPQLAGEIGSGSLTREATQRSSTVKELLALRFQMEKQKDGDAKPQYLTFIQNIFEARSLDANRLARLVSEPVEPPRQLPSGLSGDADGDEGPADDA